MYNNAVFSHSKYMPINGMVFSTALQPPLHCIFTDTTQSEYFMPSLLSSHTSLPLILPSQMITLIKEIQFKIFSFITKFTHVHEIELLFTHLPFLKNKCNVPVHNFSICALTPTTAHLLMNVPLESSVFLLSQS